MIRILPPPHTQTHACSGKKPRPLLGGSHVHDLGPTGEVNGSYSGIAEAITWTVEGKGPASLLWGTGTFIKDALEITWPDEPQPFVASEMKTTEVGPASRTSW